MGFLVANNFAQATSRLIVEAHRLTSSENGILGVLRGSIIREE